MKIGILTGGGDTQALNAIIYGTLMQAEENEDSVIGFKQGWKGVLDPVDYIDLNPEIIDPDTGGTYLRSSRTKLNDQTEDEAIDNIEKIVDGLIAVGGDDTLSVGSKIAQKANVPVCLVSKTIDNDVGKNAPMDREFDPGQIVNYFTPGFASAASEAARTADMLKTTAYSHSRIMFLETMGRTPGWLALSGYKGGSDLILVPEVELDLGHFLGKLEEAYSQKGYAIVTVAEGIKYKGSVRSICEDDSQIDVFGHGRLGGVADILAKRVKKETGIENVNAVNPSYLYRSGKPSKLDKEVGIELGKQAAYCLQKGLTENVAVSYRCNDHIAVTFRSVQDVLNLKDGMATPRNLDMRFYDRENYRITDTGIDYFKPIFGE